MIWQRALGVEVAQLLEEREALLRRIKELEAALAEKQVAPTCWQEEVKAFALAEGLHVTSGYRKASVTVSGKRSWHATGTPERPGALDFAGPRVGMERLFDHVRARYPERVRELFYSPKGFVKNNRFYPPNGYDDAVERIHYDHVHVAVRPQS